MTDVGGPAPLGRDFRCRSGIGGRARLAPTRYFYDNAAMIAFSRILCYNIPIFIMG